MIRRAVVITLAGISLVAMAVALCGELLPHAANFLDVGVPPRRVDCVLALPGDSERRPFVAAALANVGLASTLLIPENEDAPEVIDGLLPTSAEITKRIYRVRGVPTERIVVLEGASATTADDLELLGIYLDVRPRATAMVVTSAFHTRRTRWTIDVRLPHHASRILVFSAPNPGFENQAWWRSNSGFRYVIVEYLKLGYYWFRYGRGAYWGSAFAALVVIWWWRKRLAPHC